MQESFTHAVFAPQVNTRFRVRAEGMAPVELVLSDITRLKGHPQRQEPFSLVFRGPATPCLPQCIHTLEHDTLGRFEMFLVPIGPADEAMRYEAIFN